MSSFTGVSVVTGREHCTTSAVDADTDSRAGPFMVGGHKWRIRYYPNGVNLSRVEYISLDVFLGDEEDEIEEVVKVKFQFSFVGQVEKQEPKYIRSTQTCSFSSKHRRWGNTKFVKRDALEQSTHLKADCFTIRCDIMVCNDFNNQDARVTLPDIGQQFKILLQDKVGCDVTFEVSGEMFPAHRCVLAARSKVFRAQLFGPMIEGITSSAIQIKDMEAKVFVALLSFIYSDSFPEMEDKAQAVEVEEEEAVEDEIPEVEEEGQEEEAREHVTWLQWLQDLFVAADRYDIQQLKSLCEKQLSENIGVSSVASTLALAEQHHCHRLKDACLNFIQVQSPKCLGKVMVTDGWKHITTTYPSVLDELIVKLASNQKEKKRKHKTMFC
ncbi:BTB/POZ and MATH domain-containing protein 2-like [Lolium rigidum]|uniref:BTB/POZ and MATH domain-containing protein 2-like n=1 Tax=Lolium rigidum TaxID=89674 RepID=UPI001F5D79D7|nr:BTB/POZ and MATH domain-containing protein 2-like [Lolium rigidum]